MPTPDYIIKAGDLKTDIIVICKTSAGVVVNLTTAVSVKLLMGIPGGDSLKVDAAATISDAAAGEVTYSWVAANVDTEGRYVAEIEVTWAASEPSTYPGSGYIDILITRQLG